MREWVSVWKIITRNVYSVVSLLIGRFHKE